MLSRAGEDRPVIVNSSTATGGGAEMTFDRRDVAVSANPSESVPCRLRIGQPIAKPSEARGTNASSLINDRGARASRNSVVVDQGARWTIRARWLIFKLIAHLEGSPLAL